MFSLTSWLPITSSILTCKSALTRGWLWVRGGSIAQIFYWMVHTDITFTCVSPITEFQSLIPVCVLPQVWFGNWNLSLAPGTLHWRWLWTMSSQGSFPIVTLSSSMSPSLSSGSELRYEESENAALAIQHITYLNIIFNIQRLHTYLARHWNHLRF